jgi:hypothetical protein
MGGMDRMKYFRPSASFECNPVDPANPVILSNEFFVVPVVPVVSSWLQLHDDPD